MPKRISAQELEAIVIAVADWPQGARIGDILDRLPFKLETRTLQRRLAWLVEHQQLIAEGKGKGRRYRSVVAVAGGSMASMDVQAQGWGEVHIPLSRAAQEIKRAIRAPLQNRQPVGYQPEFLNDYQPNRTNYLPAETRQHLLAIGAPPGGERPAGTYARTIFSRLLIDLSWNSSRLEGNTYSLLETERLLQLGEAAEGGDARDAQMILNHKAAIEMLVDQAEGVGFNRYSILNLHALLADNLLADPLAGGRLRRIPVGIDGTVYHPLEVPQLIEERFETLLRTAAAIEDPFEQAFFALVHLPYLQPFEDVNKRVSRLAANIPLVRGNLCPLSFVDVPERAYIDGMLAIYESNRTELLREVFVWAYERSSARYSAVRQSLGQPDPFRLRFRGLVAEVVTEAVRTNMDKLAATSLARKTAIAKVSPADQARFIEVAEIELMSLHEGNIARYRLRPSEFNRWQQHWR